MFCLESAALPPMNAGAHQEPQICRNPIKVEQGGLIDPKFSGVFE